MINSQQIIVAKYLYDPFGNILSKSGPLADVNTYRFSSQEYHQNSGLVIYLYRAYDANLQRWLSRDPIEERGGLNLYGFVHNEPTTYFDTDGRQELNPIFTPRFIPRILPDPVETGYPRLTPPFPITPAQDGGPQPFHPVSPPPPSEDPFPPLNDYDKAPDNGKCKQTCTDARLKELTSKVNSACKGKLSTCHGDGPYWLLVEKFHQV